MAEYQAIVKQSEDGTWEAQTLSPTVVTGMGKTKEEALTDLKVAMQDWLDHMKKTGQTVPARTMQLIEIEVSI